MSEVARSPARTKRWTRLEYERLVDLGAFGPEERLELIGGQLVVREPQGRPHATGIRLVAAALRAAFGPGWTIEAQLPVALDEESEPEPDIAVLPGDPRDYLAPHQITPALVVEVALSSLALDREEKGSLYARAGVRDYWIANLLDNVLECTETQCRIRPGPMAGATARPRHFAPVTSSLRWHSPRSGSRSLTCFSGGSVARGEAGPDSDRDLFDQGQLQMDLEELLGRKVDVVTERGLAPHLRDRVLREAIPL